MFKIAYGAGHNDATANGIPESLHKPFMNEWQLNDRVARYFAEAAKEYPVELLRVDDPEGKAPVDLAQRCKKANDWGADFFLSIHHNAGINGGSGGGLVAFCRKAGTEAAKYRNAIYDACMANGGLKGDRWDPTLETAFYVLSNTTMPAVLMEYGFMDSTTDVPVILSEDYARKMAYATMEGIAKAAGIKKAVEKTYTLKLPQLSRGSTGPSVTALQRLLGVLQDGSFGPVTEQAVLDFQKKAGLGADGIVGIKTMGALLGQ